MPCNLAVTIGKAAVTKTQLLALLTLEIVQKVVLAYLQQQYSSLSPRVASTYNNRLVLVMGDFQVEIENGEVAVTNYARNRAQAEKLATELEQVLAQLADGLFQQKVQQLLGALVTKVETVQVNNEGVPQQAAVFTLEM